MSNKNKTSKESNHLSNNFLFISPQRGLYLGTGFGTRFHSFHALKICIGVDGEIGLRTGLTANYERCRAAMVAPDQTHKLNGHATRLALLYLLPETAEARQIAETYLYRGVSIVPQTKVDALLPQIHEYLKHGCGKENASELCHNLIQTLIPSVSLADGFDCRVARALKFLRSALDQQVTVEEIAKAAWSSYSRLARIFKAQTGIVISHYRRWLRLCASIEQMADTNSLTDIAYAAGFADLAHLDKTFRQMLGIAPSFLFRNSRIVRGESLTDKYNYSPAD